MTSESSAPRVLAVVRDLMFASKITATARALNVQVQILREPAQLIDQPANRVMVDLNQPGTLVAAADWKRATGGAIIGFVSHVDSAIIEAARGAGFDQVLPRSRFVDILPDLLK